MGYIKYYPASRVKTNLRTSGDQYTLNGTPYNGVYYLTYRGEAFTGPNPAVGPNDRLVPVQSIPSALTDKKSRFSFPKTSKSRIKEDSNIEGVRGIGVVPSLKMLKPYYPIVLEEDYVKGYITRYFAKKVNTNSFIIEISPTDYEIIQNAQEVDYEDYLAMSMFWQVSGPTHDVRVSQYQVKSGVYDTNKRVTEGKAKGFNGIVEFIGGQYTKYARLTD